MTKAKKASKKGNTPAKKKPAVRDLTPRRNPTGGNDYDMPPGQEKKTGGAGGA